MTWKNESSRHSLASRGISTKTKNTTQGTTCDVLCSHLINKYGDNAYHMLKHTEEGVVMIDNLGLAFNEKEAETLNELALQKLLPKPYVESYDYGVGASIAIIKNLPDIDLELARLANKDYLHYGEEFEEMFKEHKDKMPEHRWNNLQEAGFYVEHGVLYIDTGY